MLEESLWSPTILWYIIATYVAADCLRL